MKVSTPKSRQDLHIKRRDRVLEVGPGNRPSFRANVLVEKFLGDDTHRCGGLRIFPHQQLVNAAAEALPFADKEFDYVICNQVLEHSDDPAQFLREVTRVGKAGYIETPSLLGEWLFPKKSHRWVVLNIGDKLVLYDKQRVPGNYANDYGELFLNYLPYQSLPYKLLPFTEGELMHVRYEWKDGIDFLINPTDEYYSKFFLRKWDREMVCTLFPPRGFVTELRRTLCAAAHVIGDKLRRSQERRSLSLEEYKALHPGDFKYPGGGNPPVTGIPGHISDISYEKHPLIPDVFRIFVCAIPNSKAYEKLTRVF